MIIKQYCQYKGIMCSLATEFGYCKVTACINREEGRMTNQRAIKVINVFLGTDDLCLCSKDCLHVSCKDCRREAARMAIEALKAQQWIPCSERLPKTNGVYIVARWFGDGCEKRILSDACYFDGSDTWYDDTRLNHGREYVTHKIVAWMPLPESYKENEL